VIPNPNPTGKGQPRLGWLAGYAGYRSRVGLSLGRSVLWFPQSTIMPFSFRRLRRFRSHGGRLLNPTTFSLLAVLEDGAYLHYHHVGFADDLSVLARLFSQGVRIYIIIRILLRLLTVSFSLACSSSQAVCICSIKRSSFPLLTLTLRLRIRSYRKCVSASHEVLVSSTEHLFRFRVYSRSL
jgi:hypothetical protein